VRKTDACILCGAALAVAVTSGPIAAQTTVPSEGLTPSPMVPHRNADGSIIKRGLRNEIQTGYWSGFAATAAAPYSSASGTFQVPSVIYSGIAGTAFSSLWVGIGGFGDYTLIQLGVLEAVGVGGAVYRPWCELYPAPALYLSHTVKPGDIITASLQCTAACSPSQVQTWQLLMTDETEGWAWTQSFQYQSSMASAEWITEAPFIGSSEMPLADYTRATFDPVSANGANPNLTLFANGIQMLDPGGQTSNPSAPVGGDAFSTCWGLAPSFTPCTAGSINTPPPPATSASLSANPKSITKGRSSTLAWSSKNAASCTGGGFTASGTKGSAAVRPTVTTAYSVTCTGGGESATAMATVTMKPR
jgi:hypothetical protein